MLKISPKRVTATIVAIAAVFGSGLLLTQSSCGCTPPAPESKAWPAVTGTAAVGSTLTADNGTWVTSGNHSGHGNSGYTYQWQRCTTTSSASCVNIGGATSSTYTLASADGGDYARVLVTATSVDGLTGSQASVQTAAVTGGSSAPLLVGIDGWGGGNASDQVSLGSPTGGSNGVVRADMEGSGTLNSSTGASQFYNVGGKVIFLISGCLNACASNSANVGYSTSGVADITASTWGTNAVSLYGTRCGGSSVNCPAVEVLNEPCIFWNGHCDQTSETKYAQILQAAYTDFHTTYGSNAPKILASYDGGESNPTSLSWGRGTTNVSNNGGITVSNYVDGWTIHAYGGYNNNCSGGVNVDCAANGARGSVLTAASETGKPIWTTETGWPTDCTSSCPSTINERGDSLQWNTTQQAQNIYNFIAWARSEGTGIVAEVNIYEYQDESTVAAYGVRTTGAANKPSYTAIKQGAQGVTCTVC